MEDPDLGHPDTDIRLGAKERHAKSVLIPLLDPFSVEYRQFRGTGLADVKEYIDGEVSAKHTFLYEKCNSKRLCKKIAMVEDQTSEDGG